MSDLRPGADYIKTIREQRAEIERLQMLYEGEVENRLNIAKSHDLQTAEIERLRAALERAYKAGHNDDCLFCGFKDKILIEELHTQSGNDD